MSAGPKPWAKTFPDRFYDELFRLHAKNPQERSRNQEPWLAQVIDRIIYQRLEHGVREALHRVDPIPAGKRRRMRQLHRHITRGEAERQFAQLLGECVGALCAAQSWTQFLRLGRSPGRCVVAAWDFGDTGRWGAALAVPPVAGRRSIMSGPSFNGAGHLRRVIEGAAGHLECSLSSLTVLSAARDPYRIDTPAGRRDGAWFAEQIERFLAPNATVHLRGMHYRIAAAADVRLPSGLPYTNTDEAWTWLDETAAKAARWLGYVAFERIVDQRNAPPEIFVPESSHPYATLSGGLLSTCRISIERCLRSS